MTKMVLMKSQFKPKVLAYLREVEESGEALVITDHGRPVVRVAPYAPAGATLRAHAWLRGPLRPPDRARRGRGLGSSGVIVLDTHAWLWWLSDPARVSAHTRSRIDAALDDGALAISAISAWEVAMLVATMNSRSRSTRWSPRASRCLASNWYR